MLVGVASLPPSLPPSLIPTLWNILLYKQATLGKHFCPKCTISPYPKCKQRVAKGGLEASTRFTTSHI